MEDRVRQSRGSVDRQTLQSQPIWGIPVEVPVPKNLIFIYYRLDIIVGSVSVSHQEIQDIGHHRNSISLIILRLKDVGLFPWERQVPTYIHHVSSLGLFQI